MISTLACAALYAATRPRASSRGTQRRAAEPRRSRTHVTGAALAADASLRLTPTQPRLVGVLEGAIGERIAGDDDASERACAASSAAYCPGGMPTTRLNSRVRWL